MFCAFHNNQNQYDCEKKTDNWYLCNCSLYLLPLPQAIDCRGMAPMSSCRVLMLFCVEMQPEAFPPDPPNQALAGFRWFFATIFLKILSTNRLRGSDDFFVISFSSKFSQAIDCRGLLQGSDAFLWSAFAAWSFLKDLEKRLEVEMGRKSSPNLLLCRLEYCILESNWIKSFRKKKNELLLPMLFCFLKSPFVLKCNQKLFIWVDNGFGFQNLKL